MDGGLMKTTIKHWVIAGAVLVLALTPLTATANDGLTDGATPDAVPTHGGWVCVNWPVHVCVP